MRRRRPFSTPPSRPPTTIAPPPTRTTATPPRPPATHYPPPTHTPFLRFIHFTTRYDLCMTPRAAPLLLPSRAPTFIFRVVGTGLASRDLPYKLAYYSYLSWRPLLIRERASNVLYCTAVYHRRRRRRRSALRFHRTVQNHTSHRLVLPPCPRFRCIYYSPRLPVSIYLLWPFLPTCGARSSADRVPPRGAQPRRRRPDAAPLTTTSRASGRPHSPNLRIVACFSIPPPPLLYLLDLSIWIHLSTPLVACLLRTYPVLIACYLSQSAAYSNDACFILCIVYE
ncbi:hypothetical protein C8J57DRAFT_385582 [Mycena rebaudengoi]|nr:hypothetical protein C8J57DRAFT_385582 [Mycena rebaudengoi]